MKKLRRNYQPIVNACWKIVEDWAGAGKGTNPHITRLIMAMKEFDNEQFLAILTTTAVKLHTKEEHNDARDNAHRQPD